MAAGAVGLGPEQRSASPREAARSLDLDQPVAVLLLGVLHCIPDEDGPAGVVSRLMGALAPGSYLVISHPALDVGGGQTGRATRDYNDQSPVRLTMRTHAAVSAFFDGLDLVEPGVVQSHRWRPDGTGAPAPDQELANYAGIGRKPATRPETSR